MLNDNLINIITNLHSNGQEYDVIFGSLKSMGFTQGDIEENIKYVQQKIKPKPVETQPIKTIKENKNMKFTLLNMYEEMLKASGELKNLVDDKYVGFSSNKALNIVNEGINSILLSLTQETNCPILSDKSNLEKSDNELYISPFTKFNICESLASKLQEYKSIPSVENLLSYINEAFESNKYQFFTNRVINSLGSSKSQLNEALAKELKSLIKADTFDIEALKSLTKQNKWNSGCNEIYESLYAEECLDNQNINLHTKNTNNKYKLEKVFSPVLESNDSLTFNINGTNYSLKGTTISECNVSDSRYNNVVEGLKLLKFDSDNNTFKYYGKNNLCLEYNSDTEKITLGNTDITDMSLLDINEKLKASGIFDRNNYRDCDTLTKFIESKDNLAELEFCTNVTSPDLAMFLTVINVEEGLYLNFTDTKYGTKRTKYFTNSQVNEAVSEAKRVMSYDISSLVTEKLLEARNEDMLKQQSINQVSEDIEFYQTQLSKLNEAINTLGEENTVELNEIKTEVEEKINSLKSDLCKLKA